MVPFFQNAMQGWFLAVFVHSKTQTRWKCQYSLKMDRHFFSLLISPFIHYPATIGAVRFSYFRLKIFSFLLCFLLRIALMFTSLGAKCRFFFKCYSAPLVEFSVSILTGHAASVYLPLAYQYKVWSISATQIFSLLLFFSFPFAFGLSEWWWGCVLVAMAWF